MTKYKRISVCGVCGNPVIYDDKLHTLSCVGKKKNPCKTVIRVYLADSALNALFQKVKR